MDERSTTQEVRLALPEDREGIVSLTRLLHDENGLFALAPTKVEVMLDRFYKREGAIIGVIGDVGAPVAVIYLSIHQPIYTNDWVLGEEFNFVHPDHRRTRHARNLIAYAKHLSDEAELPFVIGILSNQRTEAKIRLYEQVLEKAGAFFVYNRKYAGGSAWGK